MGYTGQIGVGDDILTKFKGEGCYVDCENHEGLGTMLLEEEEKRMFRESAIGIIGEEILFSDTSEFRPLGETGLIFVLDEVRLSEAVLYATISQKDNRQEAKREYLTRSRRWFENRT